MPKSLPIENGKIKIRSWHWYLIVIWFFGLLVPPIAILIRFGIGTDFFLNIVLTLMGYIPGHAHNFYCQNIRDNTHRGRSPKWAVRYGLVEDTQKKLAKGRTWAARYDERASSNPYDNPDLPAEDEHGRPVHEPNHKRNQLGHLHKPAAPMPSESEVWEPASARSLDRPAPVEDDDSEEEFYGPDHGAGEAPGSGEANRRAQGGGHVGKMRKMVTGTNSKQGRKVQQEGRERFEREQQHEQPAQRRSNRRRADSNPYRAEPDSFKQSAASSRDAVELDPEGLNHNF